MEHLNLVLDSLLEIKIEIYLLSAVIGRDGGLKLVLGGISKLMNYVLLKEYECESKFHALNQKG